MCSAPVFISDISLQPAPAGLRVRAGGAVGSGLLFLESARIAERFRAVPDGIKTSFPHIAFHEPVVVDGQAAQHPAVAPYAGHGYARLAAFPFFVQGYVLQKQGIIAQVVRAYDGQFFGAVFAAAGLHKKPTE